MKLIVTLSDPCWFFLVITFFLILHSTCTSSFTLCTLSIRSRPWCEYLLFSVLIVLYVNTYPCCLHSFLLFFVFFFIVSYSFNVQLNYEWIYQSHLYVWPLFFIIQLDAGFRYTLRWNLPIQFHKSVSLLVGQLQI